MIRLQSLTKCFGQRTILNNLNLHVNKQDIVSLLGQNGCGKTTTLNLISGFSSPDEGEIFIDGKLVEGKDHRKIVHLSPSERKVGYVFQNAALFPHMRVHDNVAYGLKASHLSKQDVNVKTKTLLEFVGLKESADLYPHQLSGGQKQRVALARSLATEPEVLLLDEPISAVDPQLKESLRLEFKSYLHNLKITAIYVTHNLNEAFMMTDKIAIMGNGNIEQIGNKAEIFNKPCSRYVAEFLGINVYKGKAIRVQKEHVEVDVGGVQIFAFKPQNFANGPLLVTLKPEDVAITPASSIIAVERKGYNLLKGTITEVVQMRSTTQVTVDIGFHIKSRILSSVFRDSGFEVGQEVHVQFRPEDLNITTCSG